MVGKGAVLLELLGRCFGVMMRGESAQVMLSFAKLTDVGLNMRAVLVE